MLESNMKLFGTLVLLTPVVIPLMLAYACNLIGW